MLLLCQSIVITRQLALKFRQNWKKCHSIVISWIVTWTGEYFKCFLTLVMLAGTWSKWMRVFFFFFADIESVGLPSLCRSAWVVLSPCYFSVLACGNHCVLTSSSVHSQTWLMGIMLQVINWGDKKKEEGGIWESILTSQSSAFCLHSNGNRLHQDEPS